MEKLYELFTTEMLPKIQEGMTITKDYFFDLFGRYVKYLIIQDSLLMVFYFAMTVFGLYLLVKGVSYAKKLMWEDGMWIPMLIFGALLTTFATLCFIEKSLDLAKDLTIPETRVYEELKQLK